MNFLSVPRHQELVSMENTKLVWVKEHSLYWELTRFHIKVIHQVLLLDIAGRK
jgi:hypothetical protein